MIVVGMMLILILLGVFVDQVSSLPIFMPIVQSLVIDAVWFGVMFLICMQLGLLLLLLLPPHGLLLMTQRGVAPPQVTMAHSLRAVVPDGVMSLVLLAAGFYFPRIATWLPGVIR